MQCNLTLLDPGTLGGSWGRLAIKGDCFLLGGTFQQIIICYCFDVIPVPVISFIIVRIHHRKS